MSKPRVGVPEVIVLRKATWPNHVEEVRINGEVIPGVRAVTTHERAGELPELTLTLVADVRNLTKLNVEETA